MGRWEPNARERLSRAALDLFVEKGYETTTAAEIAQRAGLGKSTFFRHFADKREVLFGGQEDLHAIFTDAITGAPAGAAPLDVVAAALDAAGAVFDEDRRAWARRRQAVIMSATELIERELLKRSAITDVMAAALRARGLPDPAAGIVAELGNLAFRGAFARWIGPGEARGFRDLAREELDAVRAALKEL